MVSAHRDEFGLSCSVHISLINAPRSHRPISPHTRLDSRSSSSRSTCTRRGVRGRTTNSPRYFVEANPRYIRLVASHISYSISVSYYHTHSIYLLQIQLGNERGREPAPRGGCRRDRFGWGLKQGERGGEDVGGGRQSRSRADGTSTNAASNGDDGDGDDGDDTERRSLWRISFAGWWGSARLRLP